MVSPFSVQQKRAATEFEATGPDYAANGHLAMGGRFILRRVP
jgi:hypothetical protein